MRVKDRFASCCCCIDDRSILQSTHDQQAASKPAWAAAGRENACARVPIDRDVRATPSINHMRRGERGRPACGSVGGCLSIAASSITGTRHFTWKPPRAPPTPSSTSRLHIITSRNSRVSRLQFDHVPNPPRPCRRVVSECALHVRIGMNAPSDI